MSEQTPQLDPLQALIEKRASTKLLKDLSDLERMINSNSLLKHNRIPVVYTEKLHDGYRDIDFCPRDIFRIDEIGHTSSSSWKKSNSYMGKLYQFWFPIYIENETREIIERLDLLQEQINQIRDSI